MKRGAPLKTFARLERRTPLRAKISGLAQGTVTPSQVRREPGNSEGGQFHASPPLRAGRSLGNPAFSRKTLRSAGRIKPKRPRRIDRETPREAFYKIAIHRLPCVGIAHFPDHACAGPIEQSHERSIAKGSGVGVKLKNTESCAMCWGLARAWDMNLGEFEGWTKARRGEFMAARVSETKAVLEPLWIAQEARAES